MTTITDMIQNLDNYNYRGSNRPILRVNNVYEVVVNGNVRHTEYTKNDNRGRVISLQWLKRDIEKCRRWGMEEEDIKILFASMYLRITDRHGEVVEEKIPMNF